MKTITPQSQDGFNICVDFIFDNDESRTDTISLKPYYTDEVRTVQRLDKEGIQMFDVDGEPIMETKITQVWHDPSDDLAGFLRAYGEALEAGIEAAKPPVISTDVFGHPL